MRPQTIDARRRSAYRRKKAHAKRCGVEFTLRYDDVRWPDHCPVLGITINYHSDRCADDSPSFDRIDPSGGYTPTNTIIVSNKANVIKSHATIVELERVASYYRQLKG